MEFNGSAHISILHDAFFMLLHTFSAMKNAKQKGIGEARYRECSSCGVLGAK